MGVIKIFKVFELQLCPIELMNIAYRRINVYRTIIFILRYNNFVKVFLVFH